MNINRMYQYSLAWFMGHLTSAIDNTDKVDDVQQRIKDLKKYFTYFIYNKLCRSLQEKVLDYMLDSKNKWEIKWSLKWKCLTT